MTPNQEDQEYVLFRGLKLPPQNLRWGGPRYWDDEFYVRSAEQNARNLSSLCGLAQASKVLDVGCGTGRLLTGILSVYGSIEEFVGIDVHKPSIEWATRYLGSNENNVKFQWINMLSERYNPNGVEFKEATFPVASESFDVITLFSVFSHMRMSNIRAYLKEIRRALAPGGKVFLSVFVEHGVSMEVENPEGYNRKWSGPLHCVRLNRHAFENSVYESGFAVAQFRYRHTKDGQSTYVLFSV